MKRAAFTPDQVARIIEKPGRRKNRLEAVHRLKLSDEEYREELEAEIFRDPLARGLAFTQELAAHFPADHGAEVPDEGAWVLVKHAPRVGFPTGVSFQPPPLSIWFALAEWRPSSRMRGTAFRHLARILTPEGEMCLEPHEYVVFKSGLSNLLSVDDGSQVKINYLSGDAAIDEDKLFYLQSRGIARSRAVLMLVDHVRNQNWCWFSLPVEYAQMFGFDRPPRGIGERRPSEIAPEEEEELEFTHARST